MHLPPPSTGRPPSACRSAAVVGLSLLLAVIPPCRAAAQSRPLPISGGGTELPERLPAPTLALEQMGTGCVRLAWTPVEGAASYVLGRSMGTNGYQRVPDAPTGQATEYLDSHVTAGVRVSYTVTPIDGGGIAGGRATSANLVPTITPAGDCRAPATVPAPSVVLQRSGDQISASWSARAGMSRYDVEHFVNGQTLGRESVSGAATPVRSYAASPGEHRVAVRAYDAMGNASPFGSASLVVDAPVTSGGAAPGTDAGPASGAGASSLAQGAELAFAVSGAVTLRVGGTSRLPAASGAQWVSLDPGVARVDGGDRIRASASGEARVVGVSAGAGGGVRVTVVRVVVTP